MYGNSGLGRGFDRWLTTEPEDDFTPYCEAALDAMSGTDDALWEAYEKVLFNTDTENKWLNRLYMRGYSPTEAGTILRKLFLKRTKQ